MSDVKTRKRKGMAWGVAAAPADAHAVGAQRRDAHVPVATRINQEERLLANHRCLGNPGIRRLGPVAFGRMYHADKDHIPVGAGPAAPFAVARDPLLLRAGVDVAVDQRVGDPAAAGPAVALVQNKIPEDVHATEGHGLRHGPLHGATGRRNRDSLDIAPERAGGVIAGQAGIGVHVADDVDPFGNIAHAGDLGIEPDRDVHMVFAGQEQQRVALEAEFTVLLHGINFVDLFLDFGRGHCRAEDKNIGAEVGSWSALQVLSRKLRGAEEGRESEGAVESAANSYSMKGMHRRAVLFATCGDR